ncbi:hypothetical protein CBR_g63119 [Chara braunii]|uniref:Retrotransposon gag domain-containing protein n=1 Tax=Chara braunii TaxID=69332 RepID=A0A388K934_CHABU|nr:hypothetical protein CBR_g63119 [Chara braunii]|eukprot:GBG66536.1 hypothetical protein CBR_g63119 [Chara braunii]
MFETAGTSVDPKKGLTLDDLIAAIDRHERNPSNIPKIDTFHFCGERVSEWLEWVEQALVGRSDVVKFQRILQYVLHSYHQEVKKVIDAAQGSWERFKEGMQRKYRMGDGLLTTADLEAMNKEDFTTIGAFVQEFKKRARKVHGISEEAQCAIFLGLLTASEAVELTRHGGGSTKFTWATMDRGVEVGCLDQVEQRQGTQRESRLGDVGRRVGKEVIEVGEDTPPQAPAVDLRPGDAPGSTRQAEERLRREEAPLPSSERAPSPEGRAGRRRERAAVRGEALTLIDRHIAAYALEHPDLEEPAPAEPRQEPYQPEKEMEAEIPKRVDLRTRERVPAGETAEEKRARRTRRIDKIWQERQRLEAAGELPEQQQERQRSEAAGALPGQPPSAPARAPEIPEMWRDFWEQRGEELPSPVRAGFGVARKAEERLDRKIKFLAKTTFDRHLLLEGDLTGKKMKEASHGVRLEAMEMEIQDSQAAIIESLRQQTQGRVDRPESSRQGEQRQPGQGLPGQPSAAEPRQEPPMGRVILEPQEARAQRQARREAFEFRAPTELATLPVAAAGPVVPLAVEEGLPPSSSETAQGSAEGP